MKVFEREENNTPIYLYRLRSFALISDKVACSIKKLVGMGVSRFASLICNICGNLGCFNEIALDFELQLALFVQFCASSRNN